MYVFSICFFFLLLFFFVFFFCCCCFWSFLNMKSKLKIDSRSCKKTCTRSDTKHWNRNPVQWWQCEPNIYNNHIKIETAASTYFSAVFCPYCAATCRTVFPAVSSLHTVDSWKMCFSTSTSPCSAADLAFSCNAWKIKYHYRFCFYILSYINVLAILKFGACSLLSPTLF